MLHRQVGRRAILLRWVTGGEVPRLVGPPGGTEEGERRLQVECRLQVANSGMYNRGRRGRAWCDRVAVVQLYSKSQYLLFFRSIDPKHTHSTPHKICNIQIHCLNRLNQSRQES